MYHRNIAMTVPFSWVVAILPQEFVMTIGDILAPPHGALYRPLIGRVRTFSLPDTYEKMTRQIPY